MSSYLNIAGVKGEEKFQILSFCRNSEVYRYFYESCHYSEDYRDLTDEILSKVIQDLDMDLYKLKNRINEYSKHAGGNLEIIDNLIEYKQDYDELLETKHYVEFIKIMQEETKYSWTCFEKLVFNVD